VIESGQQLNFKQETPGPNEMWKAQIGNEPVKPTKPAEDDGRFRPGARTTLLDAFADAFNPPLPPENGHERVC
jgi:hypothetical protein